MPHVLVAQPIDAAGLEQCRTMATVEIAAPFGPGHVLSGDQAARTQILFSDVAPANAVEMASLRWIQLGSHGYSQFNGIALPRGVRVCNASGVNDIPIAEWCVLMMLAFERGLVRMLDEQRAHRWNRDVQFQAELRGRRVGILGYGNIGQEVARHCHALGLQVWTLSRFRSGARELRYHPVEAPAPVPDRRFLPGERAEFLGGLDYLVVTTPATSATRGYLDRSALAELPPHAVLLNPARAQVVDESALIEALRAGTIAGAALDDHYRTPMPADDPFWELPNTIVSPHVSGSTGSTYYRERIWDLFNRNLRRDLNGEPLLDLIPECDLELA
ncbi:MAG TPA: D-2-hydroxyacid dehydrogenase [Jatrophihabitantaceae bacterium]